MARYKCPICDFEGDLFVIDGHLRHSRRQDHIYRCYCGFKHCDLGKDGMATHANKCAEAQEKLPIGATKDLAKLQKELDTIAMPNAADVPLKPVQIEESAQAQTNSAASGTGLFNFGHNAFPAALPYGRPNEPSGPYLTPFNTSRGLRGPPGISDGQDYTGSSNFVARPTKRAKMSSMARDSPGTPVLQTKRGQKGKMSKACEVCAKKKKKCKHRQSTQTDDGAVAVPAVTVLSPASNTDAFDPYGSNVQDPFTASSQALPIQPPFEVPLGPEILPAQQSTQRSGPQPLQQPFAQQARKDSIWDQSLMPAQDYEQELQKQIDLGDAFQQALARPGPDFSPQVPNSFRSEQSTGDSSNSSNTNQPLSNHDLDDDTVGNDFANPQNQLMTGPLHPQQMLILPQDEQQLPFSQQMADGLMGINPFSGLSWIEDLNPNDTSSGLPMSDPFETVEDDVPGSQQWENTYPVEPTQEEQSGEAISFQDLAENCDRTDDSEYPPGPAEGIFPRAYEQTVESTRAYERAQNTELHPQAPDWQPQAYDQQPDANNEDQDEPQQPRNVTFPQFGYGFDENGDIYDL